MSDRKVWITLFIVLVAFLALALFMGWLVVITP